jgi:NAD+ synthase (glutamine-hydrolysing)
MNNYGFIRTAAAVPALRLADTRANTKEICRIIEEALAKEVSLLVFPELTLTGATCGDLYAQEMLLKGAEEGIREILEFSIDKRICIVVGAPVRCGGRLYNCAVIIKDGELVGMVPKTYGNEGTPFCSEPRVNEIPYANEIRYAGQYCLLSTSQLFDTGDVTFAVELGEDLWSPVAPSLGYALAGAQIIVNLSACPEVLFKDRYRKDLLSQHSARTHTGYVYASAGFGESTTDSVYAGAASIWENGDCLAQNERFCCESSLIIADVDVERLSRLRSKDRVFCGCNIDNSSYVRTDIGPYTESDIEKALYRHIEAHPFAPASDLDYRCSEILSIQATGLVSRLRHINCSSAVIGISGGLDSTLALLVTALAFDKLGWSRERIIGVTMPGYGTTARTKNNATDLMEALGITSREISIVAACDQHFQDIGHDKNVHDVTFENSQARERTQILMDVANQTGGLVIGTGDLSELALGWATYNGDQMSMYGVNASVPKTLVRHMVEWRAECEEKSDVKHALKDVVATPVSPELLPANEQGEIAQKTEDLVGPYELHDFFIYHFLRNKFSPAKILFMAEQAFDGSYDRATIIKWLRTFLRRFFAQQFKRSAMPDGAKVGTVSLSPRGDWMMPSDAVAQLWLDECDNL